MVPGSLACGSAVFAAMTTFAPSLAARRAMALPIPRLAPEMKRVLPLSELTARAYRACGALSTFGDGLRRLRGLPLRPPLDGPGAPLSTLSKRSTAEQALRDHNLRGLKAIVTGANSGIGTETARVL